MFETVLNNTNSHFGESFFPQLLTLSLNLYSLMQDTNRLSPL